MYRLINILLAALGLVALTTGVHASESRCEHYDNPKVRHVVELVHEAVALVERDGKKAFTRFSEKGSKWYDGEVYIYVHSLDGTLLANGAFPSLVGSNMSEFRGLTKKKMVKLSIYQVTRYGRDSGWVHYLWPRPGQLEPSWKSSYVHLATGPDGSKYYVGAGLHDIPAEACFAVQMVNDAAFLIEREGARAFPYIRSRTGPFLWKDAYVFVVGADGTSLVNPPDPEVEGQDLSKDRDKNRVNIMDAIRDATRESGAGWVEYLWPKPGMLPATTKRTYVKRVRSGGMEYYVGCGLYLD